MGRGPEHARLAEIGGREVFAERPVRERDPHSKGAGLIKHRSQPGPSTVSAARARGDRQARGWGGYHSLSGEERATRSKRQVQVLSAQVHGGVPTAVRDSADNAVLQEGPTGPAGKGPSPRRGASARCSPMCR